MEKSIKRQGGAGVKAHICDDGLPVPYEWVFCSMCRFTHVDFEVSEEEFKKLYKSYKEQKKWEAQP